MTTCFLALIWDESIAIGSKYTVVQSSSIPIISTHLFFFYHDTYSIIRLRFRIAPF